MTPKAFRAKYKSWVTTSLKEARKEAKKVNSVASGFSVAIGYIPMVGRYLKIKYGGQK